MLNYENLISKLDSQVEIILLQQVIDQQRSDFGGFVGTDGLAGPTGVSAVAHLGYAYLLEESRYYRSPELLERILMAAGFGRRARRPSGRFDLVITNFDSAPDTGFLVQAIAPVVRQARLVDRDRGATAIAEALGELVRTAAPGMASGGFHTPNHRWVLVAAMAMAEELFPELEVRDAIDAYLNEGIDISEEGEYTERSTGTYNAVVNRSLRIAAEILGRPELLVPVRLNLDLSYHLMHADGTVVTSISTRQDRGTRVVPVGLADSYHAMAHLDGNGFYAAVADWLCALKGDGLICLPNFVRHPEWRGEQVPRQALPDCYSRVYPASGLWRVRRKELSATAAAGITAPFSVRCGEVELAAVKLSSTYFATGQFIGENFQQVEGGIRMRHRGSNRLYPGGYEGGVYWLPVDERVTAANWEEVRARRRLYQLAPLTVDLEVREVAEGFDLYVRTGGGVDGVPFQIECVFAPGGELELDSGVVEGAAGRTILLKSGYATYRVGQDAIRVGPGMMRHRMWHMRNSEPEPENCRLLITLMTPVDRILEIRCGRWSWGVEDLVGAVRS